MESGVLADKCTSRFGRRRPYMMLGTLLCMSGMLLLGFTRGVASIFTGWDNDAVRVQLYSPDMTDAQTERYPDYLARRIGDLSNRLLYQRW